MTRAAIFAAIAMASVASAQPLSSLSTSSLSLVPDQQWEVPALGYGPNAWSILRFTNSSDTPAPVHVDVYCGAGDRLALGPAFTVEPGKPLDIRIEAPSAIPVLCWARVNSKVHPPQMQLQAFTELLKGNQLEAFDRKPAMPTANGAWAITGVSVSGQQLYILNSSEKQTVFTLCASDKPDAKACDRKGANPVQRAADPRQAVLIDIRKFAKKYLIALSSHPDRAIIEVFNDDPGHRKVYTSETSISFDVPDDAPQDAAGDTAKSPEK